jgi:hypothetical protein
LLNSKGRYVRPEESDLFVDRVWYGRWWISLYKRLPERIRDDEDPSGKRLPTVSEMTESLGSVYAERDLGGGLRYRVLPRDRKEARKQNFLRNHFKIPKNHRRRADLEAIKSEVLETDDYGELQRLLTDFLNKCYKNNQISKIYRNARNSAMKMARGTVYDGSDLEEMNSEVEYRKPVPLTLFSQKELAPFVQRAAKPPKEEPKAKTIYMLNSEGRYVPKGESNLVIGRKGCSELNQSLLEELKAKTNKVPGGKGITPTEVLRAIAEYLFDEKGHPWHILPREAKMRKIESLCAKYGLDPSAMSGREGFIRAFVKSKKASLVGKTKKGKNDYRMVYAICNDIIRKREDESKEPVTQETIDKINKDLEFPEHYQIPLF